MTKIPTTEPSAVVVQLSDLHFSVDDPGLEARNALIRERLCADLEMLVGQLGRPADVVVVTGDIAYGGKEAEYQHASAWFQRVIDPITNGSTRVLCVPGNHDVDWNRIGQTHKAHRLHIARCPDEELDSMLDEYLSEDGQAILHPLGAYNVYASSIGCQILDRFCWDSRLPIGGGYELDFRGVTTVVNSYDSDGPGTLAVHANQLLKSPAPGRVPILLAHHDTFFWRRQHKLHTEVTRRMAVAMYGHTHTPRMQKVENCLEVTGGAVQPEEGKDWMPAYNLLRLSVAPTDGPTATMTVEVWRRRWGSDYDGFVPDTESGTCDVRQVEVSAASPTPASETETAPDGAEEEVRVALTTPEGDPHPVREVQRALYDLGAGDRITILAELGLPIDDLAELPAHRLIPEAAAAVVAAGQLDAFRRILAERGNASHGGAGA
ncbi:MAG: metallophosphoesterase family protein [Acidimicrobiales bacterium]